MGEKLGGIAVHTGTRVAALADAGEVLVSGTVKDLVAVLRDHVREARRPHAEGHSRRVAALRRRVRVGLRGDNREASASSIYARGCLWRCMTPVALP
jgi:hypothetical protein